MKVYYGDDEAFLYPATHNFKDEVDGTLNDDIEFITSVAGTDTGKEASIIAEEDGHRKVLKCISNGDNGTNANFVFGFVDQTDGTIELWWKYIDKGVGYFILYLFDEDPQTVIYMRFNSADNKLYLYHGDGLGGNTTVTVDIASNTWCHTRIEFDCATDTFSCWVDGVNKIDGENLYSDRTATTLTYGYFQLSSSGGANALEGYVDAFAASADTDYKIGDNVHWRNYKESTDSFEGDDVGTQGTSITWVDFADPAASFEIVPEFNEHKKVLRGYYSSGEDGHDYCYHTFSTRAKNGWFAGWIKSSDVTVTDSLDLVDDVAGNIVQIRFTGSKLQYYDGNATAWQDGPAAVNNTWYFIYIQWYDAANDYYDFWVNNIRIAATVQCTVNQNTGINLSQLAAYGAASYIYIDAPMSSLDGDTIGDNLEVESTEYDLLYVKERIGWNQIENIIEYPVPIARNNTVGICSLILRDFEGGLYPFWKNRDFNVMLILDADNNILFRGFLTNKKYTERSLEMTLEGIGKLLEWKHFDRNYILEEGYVKTVNASSVLDMFDDADGDGEYDVGEDFTWDVDQWIIDRHVGLLVEDNTNDLSSETWTCGTNPTVAYGIEVAGDKDSLDAANDDDVYHITDSGRVWDAIITITNLTGVAIANTNALNKIIVNYRFGIKAEEANMATMKFTLQIKKDTTWKTLKEVNIYGIVSSFIWYSDSVMLEAEDVDNADTELQKYLNEVGGDYTSLHDFRIVVDSKDAYYICELKLDLLTADIYYYSAAIAPVMKAITDSAASTITCSGVADWTATGVKVGDQFKIGQNTATIAKEIGEAAGIAIDIIGQTVTGSADTIIRPNADGGTLQWTRSGVGDHYEDIDEVVEDPTAGDGDYITSTTDGLVDIIEMGTFALAGIDVVTTITAHIYAKGNSYYCGATLDISDGNIYLGAKSIGTGFNEYVWSSITWTNISLNQTQLDSLKAVFTSWHYADLGDVYVDTIYFTVTEGVFNPFDKFIAREFKGTHCIDAVKAVCTLEGAFWMEDYINNRIKLVKPSNFEDAGVSLVSANYDEWEYEDKCNQVRRVDVWGKAASNIHEYSEDTTVSGYIEKQIIDETITTKADAKTIADAELTNKSSKRPSIRLLLHGTYPNIQLGYMVALTMERPTIAMVYHKVRMIERHRMGITDIDTVVYLGLGETPLDEKIGRAIKEIGYIAHKALLDRLL